ncbi:MAG: oxalate:formate antiporter, partial [Ruminococcus sp.]|nr:oxalate:formate antiporter [Ruminococcus sp.]
MKNANTIIPCYAADTSGVCSALYEMGGMTVVHDASGCNSTYSTHDEPRWYDIDSMIYISALTELDAIMGNDEKIISDTVAAAADLKPNFIALCGSPMPMMTGVDFDAIAEEIERRSGRRSFGLHTNGTRSYIEGASEAFAAVTKEYVRELPKAEGIGVNIVGATPLDLPWKGTMDSLKRWLSDNGFTYVSSIGMGGTLEEIKRAGSAKVNLIVSYAGFAAADYMLNELGINYVCGVPFGEGFGEQLAEDIREAAAATEADCVSPYGMGFDDIDCDLDTVIIGESIASRSLAQALKLDMGLCARIICPLPTDEMLLSEADRELYAEEDIQAAL